MTLTIGLRGYPEAVLATDSVTLDGTGPITGEAAVRDLAARSPRLSIALLREDGALRRSTKVLVDGTPVPVGAPLPTAGRVTVLAALPCDG